MKKYSENCYAVTGGVTPIGYRMDFSILDHDSIDAPTYIPSGHTVQAISPVSGMTYTCPSLARRSSHV